MTVRTVPVLSELPTNPRIGDLDNTEYHIIITANTETIEEEITLQELEQTLYFDVRDWLEEERQVHRNLSVADLGVVLRGRCLYHFSKHYPDIYEDDERVYVKPSSSPDTRIYVDAMFRDPPTQEGPSHYWSERA